MKSMGMVTHKDDSKIPVGKAALVLSDNGWVGTNNGCPFHGQPALYPEAQANAICYAWNGFNCKKELLLGSVSTEVLEWLK